MNLDLYMTPVDVHIEAEFIDKLVKVLRMANMHDTADLMKYVPRMYKHYPIVHREFSSPTTHVSDTTELVIERVNDGWYFTFMKDGQASRIEGPAMYFRHRYSAKPTPYWFDHRGQLLHFRDQTQYISYMEDLLFSDKA